MNVDLRISKIIKLQNLHDLQDFKDLGFGQWFRNMSDHLFEMVNVQISTK